MLQNFTSPRMLPALFALALAFILSYVGTPLARKLARLCDCVDRPDGKRKLHADPVPYFGGLAILFGFSAAFLLFSFLLTKQMPSEIMVIFIGALSITLVGLLDDMYGMRPLTKLFWQLVIAAFTAHFGFAIEYITLFGEKLHFGVFSEPITILWLVSIINAVNLIDGLDGLACGVSVLESFALFITAILMGNPVCAVAAAALCGAALGFLPFNFTKASIFMGDAGAMLIGYVMACISVSGLFKAQALFSILVPAMIFALPVIETVTSFFRRLLKGKSPFAADHKHLHYVLVENGFTVTQSVIILIGASALFCVASVLYVKYPLPSLVLSLLTTVGLVLLKHMKGLPAFLKKITDGALSARKKNRIEE